MRKYVCFTNFNIYVNIFSGRFIWKYIKRKCILCIKSVISQMSEEEEQILSNQFPAYALFPELLIVYLGHSD